MTPLPPHLNSNLAARLAPEDARAKGPAARPVRGPHERNLPCLKPSNAHGAPSGRSRSISAPHILLTRRETSDAGLSKFPNANSGRRMTADEGNHAADSFHGLPRFRPDHADQLYVRMRSFLYSIADAQASRDDIGSIRHTGNHPGDENFRRQLLAGRHGLRAAADRIFAFDFFRHDASPLGWLRSKLNTRHDGWQAGRLASRGRPACRSFACGSPAFERRRTQASLARIDSLDRSAQLPPVAHGTAQIDSLDRFAGAGAVALEVPSRDHLAFVSRLPGPMRAPTRAWGLFSQFDWMKACGPP